MLAPRTAEPDLHDASRLPRALAGRIADLAADAHGHEALESLFIDEGLGAFDAAET